MANEVAGDDLSERIAQQLAAYDGFGLRRTGSAGDLACAHWQAAQVVAAGARAQTVVVPLDMMQIEQASFHSSDLRIDGLPLFDAPDTPAGGVTGKLAPMDAQGDIGFLECEPGAASIKGQALEALRQKTSFRALVVATRVIGESLAPINAQHYTAPFGPPILQVAGAHAAALAELASRGAQATVLTRARRSPSASLNIAAQVDVSGEGGGSLVLLTPRTSWWESTAERAGGVIAWIEGLRYAAQRRCDVRAFSSCGHELGHLGLHRMLADNASLLSSAKLWLHLGANLGCASDDRVTIRATDPARAEWFATRLAAHGYPRERLSIESIATAMGEARDLMEHGAQVLSIIGRNAHFHAPSDRWPGNVSVQRLASIVRAVSDFIESP